jgi:hypothetical protein
MKTININQLILEKLKEKDLKVAWLARQIDYNADNLRKKLKNNYDIHSNLLHRISLALNEDFHAYYSQKLREDN